MLVFKHKLGDRFIVGDVVVTVAGLGEKTVDLSLARRDGTDLGSVTVGTNGLIDLAQGVQAMIVSMSRDHVRLGVEAPTRGSEIGADLLRD